MASDQARPPLPPFNPIGLQPFGDKLRDELDCILMRTQWSGPLEERALAAALRELHDTLRQQAPQRRFAHLLGAVIDALEAGTADGWTLALQGPQGPRKSAQDLREDEEIGWYVMKRIGDGYDSAISETCKDLGCGKTKAGNCYRAVRDAVQKHEREIRAALAHISGSSRK